MWPNRLRNKWQYTCLTHSRKMPMKNPKQQRSWSRESGRGSFLVHDRSWTKWSILVLSRIKKRRDSSAIKDNVIRTMIPSEELDWVTDGKISCIHMTQCATNREPNSMLLHCWPWIITFVSIWRTIPQQCAGYHLVSSEAPWCLLSNPKNCALFGAM